jgi:signal transduction histidine kinase
VHSRRDGDTLILEIRDNGAGLPSERTTDGIGLTTTRARLERLYGDRHQLTLANLPEGGCVARIRLPFELTTDDRPDVVAAAPFPSATVPAGAAGD